MVVVVDMFGVVVGPVLFRICSSSGVLIFIVVSWDRRVVCVFGVVGLEMVVSCVSSVLVFVFVEVIFIVALL